MAKPVTHQIALVKWNDAWSSQIDFDEKEASEYEAIVMEEVGFIVSSTKSGIVLATSKSSEDPHFRYPSFIPKGMIQSITILKSESPEPE